MGRSSLGQEKMVMNAVAEATAEPQPAVVALRAAYARRDQKQPTAHPFAPSQADSAIRRIEGFTLVNSYRKVIDSPSQDGPRPQRPFLCNTRKIKRPTSRTSQRGGPFGLLGHVAALELSKGPIAGSSFSSFSSLGLVCAPKRRFRTLVCR